MKNQVLNLITGETETYKTINNGVYKLANNTFLSATNALTYDEISTNLPKRTYIYNVDYNDYLSEESIEKLMNDDFSVLDDWNTYGTEVDYVKDACKSALKHKYTDVECTEPADEDEVFQNTDWIDDLRYLVQDRDASEPLKDICRHTHNPVVYIELGVKVEDWPNQLNQLDEVKTRLGIETNEHDKDLVEMLENSNGGVLRVYFRYDTYGLVTLGESVCIKFNTLTLVVYGYDGSGHECYIPHSIAEQIRKEDIHICKLDKYSYTYDVCDMSRNWCDYTKFEIIV